jgi:hypothetical protein
MGDTYDPSGYGALFAFLAIFGLIFFLLFIVGYVIGSFFLMRLFDKAGVQGKWRAWVPVYNVMVLGKLGDVSPWVVLGAIVAGAVLGQIPAIGFIFGLLPLIVSVMYGWRVGLKLGKEWYYLLLWLIPGVGPLIWLGILAFDNSRWNPAIAPAPWANSFLADKTVWDGVPTQPAAGTAPSAAPGYPAPGAYPPPPSGYTPPPAGAGTPGASTPPATSPTNEPPAPPTEPPAPPAEPPRA